MSGLGLEGCGLRHDALASFWIGLSFKSKRFLLIGNSLKSINLMFLTPLICVGIAHLSLFSLLTFSNFCNS